MPDIVPDMEDLLKRASENYPLKESPDKWEDIAFRLSAGTTGLQGSRPSRRRYYLLALLLLLCLYIGFYVVHTGSGDHRKAGGVNKSGVKQQYGPVKEKTVVPSRNATAGLAEHNKRAAEKKGSTPVPPHQWRPGIHYPERNAAMRTEPKRMVHLPEKSRKQKNDNGWSSTGKPPEQKRPLFTGTRLDGPVERTMSTVPGYTFLRYPDKLVPYERLTFKQENKQKGTASRSMFYYGLTAGKGFSMVKNFGLQKNCFDYGLLAGYRLTGRLSLETGLLAVKKYYTSQGKDFSMDEMGTLMSTGMKLMEVEGSCRVVELPLTLRLDFLTGRNNRFFSAAGFSSLVMTKEYNTYHTMMNGVPEKIVSTYHKDRRYVAAAFNLAAGYEHRLTRSISLRLEPYIQIPVRGIGVGKLPVTSTGVRVGITRSAR